MSDALSIDLGSLLPYVEEKLRSFFGRDMESVDAAQKLERQLRIAAGDANSVQVVGMDRPVSIFDIYQPTRLIQPFRKSRKTFTFWSVLKDGYNGVIVGGPGTGKTILAHYVFAQLSRKGDDLPILVTLRRREASAFLVEFVKDLAAGRLKKARKARLVLLVDGYDEIDGAERMLVADALSEFAALDVGHFFLTCRSFYPVDAVKAHRFEIAPFNDSDSAAFVSAFSKAYGEPIDPAALLQDLEEHGFADFARHPLMLALVCILKAGPLPELPRTPVGLIERAILTLTVGWDQAKGVRRRSRLKLDGQDRYRCMKKVAYEMERLMESDATVQAAVRQFLRLRQRSEVDPHELLMEIAQWYGMLVPVSGLQWTFVHRTIHDYLAAQYWVDAGFSPKNVAEWNSRAAYAACLQDDATKALLAMLEFPERLPALAECLYNAPLFNAERVAGAVIGHFRDYPGKVQHLSGCIAVETERDFFAAAGDEFLGELARMALGARSSAHELVLGYVLAETARRRLPLSAEIRAYLNARYERDTIFAVARGEQVIEVRWARMAGA